MNFIRKSLSRQILAVTILVVLAIQTIFGIHTYRTLTTKEYGHLHENIDAMVKDMLLTVRDPMYNFDLDTVRQIADIRLSGNDYLEAIIIREEGGKQGDFVGREKSGDGTIGDIAVAPKRPFHMTVSKDILKEGQIIGRAEFFFTDVPVREALGAELRQMIVAVLALEIILVGALYAVLTHIITRPILAITRELRESAKGINAGAQPHSLGVLEAREDELGGLNRAMEQLFDARTKELHHSEERFKQLAESGFEGIIIHEEGVFVDLNRQVTDMIGYGREELIGKNIFAFVTPETRDVALNTYAEKSERVIELTLIRKDGEKIYVESRAQTIDYSGRKARIVILRDITARKLSEEKLRAAKEEAENATKLKDKFVSLVSHDLRAPLGGIVSFLKMFQQGDKYQLDETKKSGIIARTIDTANGLLTLIDKLLDLGRLQTGKIMINKRFVGVYHLAEQRIDSLAPSAEAKGVAIRNDIPRSTRIFADGVLYGEVLQNLINNAIKFSRSGDTITFFVPPDKPGTIAIRDTGTGMKPEVAQSLFKGDGRVSNPGTAGEKGTGLGLQYCSEIMSAHGGSIAVESELGKGSVFYVSLPEVKALVLIVDDVQAQREIMKEMLGGITGLEFIEAEQGEEALDRIRELRPYLVITDINMPVMDGFKLVENIKKSSLFKDTHVIVVTSVVSSGGSAKEVDIRSRAFALGAADFITKPFNAQDIVPRVRRLLDYA